MRMRDEAPIAPHPPPQPPSPISQNPRILNLCNLQIYVSDEAKTRALPSGWRGLPPSSLPSCIL